MTTGQRIRTARRHIGLTQAELAKAIGCAQRTVATWESSTSPAQPSLRSLRDISSVTGRPIPWLLGEENL